jgi:hypothetical protein
VRVLDSLKTNMGDSLAVITFLPEGSFALHPEDTLHLAHYGLVAKTLLLDGNTKSDFATVAERDYGTFFSSIISVAKSEPTFVSLDVDSSGVSDSTGGIVVKIAVDTVLPGTDLRLLGILTEDSVRTARFGGSGIYFDRVARQFVPDLAGIQFSVARGDTFYDTLRFANPGWRPDKLSASLLVMDAGSQVVLQAKDLDRFPVQGK